jgi:P27 family predicted phage terminase small subunit
MRLNTPKGLSKEAQRLWKDTATGWNISDSVGLSLLESACRWLDQLRKAERRLRREGSVTSDRFGQLRPHPALEIAKAASAEYRACIKALELEDVPQPSAWNKNGQRRKGLWDRWQKAAPPPKTEDDPLAEFVTLKKDYAI